MKRNISKKFKSYFRIRLNSLQGKITAGLILLGVLGIGAGLYPLVMYQRVHDRYEELLSYTIPTRYYCNVIEVCLSSTSSALDNFLITDNEGFAKKRQQIWQEEFSDARDALLTQTKNWNNNSASLLVYDVSVKAGTLKDMQDRIEEEYKNIRSVGGLFDSQAAQRRINEIRKLNIQVEEIIRLLDHIIEIQEEEIQQAKYNNVSDMGNIPYLIIGLGALIIFIAIFISFRISDKSFENIELTANNLDDLNEGILPDDIEGVKDEMKPIIEGVNMLSGTLGKLRIFSEQIIKREFHDMIFFDGKGELGQSLNLLQEELKVISEEEKKREWVSTGLNNFSTLLSLPDMDLQTLSHKIMRELINYLKASQGSLYIVSEDRGERELALISLFAFDQRKIKEGNIKAGEGLIGEAFQEGRTIYMTNIPESYISITSGLGESSPRCLLIVPMKVNDKVNGIIEIASFTPLQQYEIDFVEKICENLASTLITIENSEKTSKLLENAQMNAEMMRAQEEEMRQNMEELSATQEELERQRQELSSFIEAVNVSVIMMEIDDYGNINTVNPNFEMAFTIQSQEVSGKPLDNFLGKTSVGVTFNDLRHKLQHDKFYSVDLEWLNKLAEKIIVRFDFMPILNKSGSLVRIIAIGHKI